MSGPRSILIHDDGLNANDLIVKHSRLLDINDLFIFYGSRGCILVTMGEHVHNNGLTGVEHDEEHLMELRLADQNPAQV